MGAAALCETIPQIAAGTLTAVPQEHENATLAPMLNKEMAEFHLTDTATHIHNWVRGMNPWPGAWFITSGGKKLKVMSCRVAAANGEAPRHGADHKASDRSLRRGRYPAAGGRAGGQKAYGRYRLCSGFAPENGR